MANTHPNAYLQEAQEKRDQAARLVGEAEALEAQAKALSVEIDPEKQVPPSDDPEEDSAEEDDLADAENTIEGDKAYDESNPHRHGFGRKNKK